MGIDCQDRERQDVATRAYRDVLAASPEATHHTPVAGSTGRNFMSEERSCSVIPSFASLIARESKIKQDSCGSEALFDIQPVKPDGPFKSFRVLLFKKLAHAAIRIRRPSSTKGLALAGFVVVDLAV